MENAAATLGPSGSDSDRRRGWLLIRPFSRFARWAGSSVVNGVQTFHGIGAFALIALSVTITKSRVASRVVHPIVRDQIYRAGVRLLPIITFLGVAMGFVIIGQTVSLLNRVGATNYAGMIMVTVVVRELGPLATAVLVLARAGAATVVELGTARALGEIEALEALGIDPMHYLVMPRLVGMSIAISALTVYLILTALVSGYLFAFLQDVPLLPGDYFRQLAASLRWEDFVLLALKAAAFGASIAVVTCFHGLARPLLIEEVPVATTRAVVESLVMCVLLDALFITVYLVM